MTVLVVLDANALASGAAGFRVARSTPGELLRAWGQDVFELIVSEHLIAEVERAVQNAYVRTRVTPAETADFMQRLADRATIVPLTVTVQGVASHPEDDLV